MTKEELWVEIESFKAVIREFTIHSTDARMETSLNQFLTDIEDKIKILQQEYNKL